MSVCLIPVVSGNPNPIKQGASKRIIFARSGHETCRPRIASHRAIARVIGCFLFAHLRTCDGTPRPTVRCSAGTRRGGRLSSRSPRPAVPATSRCPLPATLCASVRTALRASARTNRSGSARVVTLRASLTRVCAALEQPRHSSYHPRNGARSG